MKDELLKQNVFQAAESSARRFVKLIDLDAPNWVIENELKMLAPRAAALLEHLRQRREESEKS